MNQWPVFLRIITAGLLRILRLTVPVGSSADVVTFDATRAGATVRSKTTMRTLGAKWMRAIVDLLFCTRKKTLN